MPRYPLGWRNLYGLVLLPPVPGFGFDSALAQTIIVVPGGGDWHRWLVQLKVIDCRHRCATAVCWCLLQGCNQLLASTSCFESAHDPEQAMFLRLQFHR